MDVNHISVESATIMALLQAQNNALYASQQQMIRDACQATNAIVAPAPVMPAWTQMAWVYPSIPECCCESDTPPRPRKSNCKNCGAPLPIGGLCRYCDTYNR